MKVVKNKLYPVQVKLTKTMMKKAEKLQKEQDAAIVEFSEFKGNRYDN